MIRKLCLLLLFVGVPTVMVWAAAPTTINDFFMPGSQPAESGTIENPGRCLNCHAGYDQPVEPGFNWQGSMMAQAARDPLFFATMTIANQDAPQSGDLCLRCHTPKGWLEERSVPTDGSLLTADDREGVQCDFCHRLVKPTEIGVNPYPDDSAYTAGTYAHDQAYLGSITAIPPVEADGMYIVDSDNTKRGPYAETVARHAFWYSPFHKESALCGTCHDVSNPAFSRDPGGKYVPNAFDSAAPSFDPYDLFPVERTYSEWLMSSYNSAEGVYAPQFGGNLDTVRTCQDCHMRDVTGAGCDKNDAPIRSDLGLHDMTGGNTFIPTIIDAVFPGETNLEALDSGIVRARRMLQLAASLDVVGTTGSESHQVDVTVTNETGHKLPSGYPEGRRIWLNVRAYDSNNNLVYESGAYDTAAGVLTHDADAKIYEIKPGISTTLAPVVGVPDGPSFHFVLNDTIYSDNRIPPRGFTNADFEMIQSPPVGYSYPDGQYWDETQYQVPLATAEVVVTLYYQTTSKEYIEFLRDENVTDDWGTTLYNLWDTNGKSAPEIMNQQTIQLTPVAGNNPPVLDPLGPRETDENVNLNFTVTATDPDGTIPDLTAANLPAGAGFTDHEDGSATFDWTPDYSQSGTYDVTFYATDDSSAVDSEVVTITVHDVNRPPVLASIGAQTVASGGNLAVEITATDPDGTTPTIAAVTPLPSGATLVDHGNGSATFDWTPDPAQEGDHSVIFFADDGALADSETVVITVTSGNSAPLLDPIGDKTVGVGVELTFTVTANDPDADSVGLWTENLPAGAVFTEQGWDAGLERYTAAFSWTPQFDQSGVHADIRFVADDGSLVDDELITITVESYLCGDIDSDGTGPNVADLTYFVNFIFKGGPEPENFDAADVNDDGSHNVSDLTYLVNFLFKGGPAPLCDGVSAR